MLFSSIPFLYFFLPITLLLYLVAPRKLKNSVILLASLVFYAWGEKKLVILFAATIFMGWILGILIEKTRGKGWDKFFLSVSVIIDLGLLAYFKYVDFFIENINKAFSSSIPLLNVALPIGISFYTFQILSYTIDVYRADVPAQKNIINFASYVALFPQLIAGPIVRYSDIADRLESRTHSLGGVAEGIRRSERLRTRLFCSFGCMPRHSCFKSILTFPVTATWLSDSEKYSGSTSWKTSTTRIFQAVSRSSGADGTFRSAPGSGTMYISPSEGTEKDSPVSLSTSVSYGCSPVFGTERLGTSCFGVFCTLYF